jgi:hypothetical protein
MSAKSVQRLFALAAVATLAFASSSAALPLRQTAGAEREGISAVVLHLLPAKVRVWIEDRDRQPVQAPRTGQRTLKCGGGIDPNGTPCH